MPNKEEYSKNKKKYLDKWNAWARTINGQFITSKNHAKKNNKEWTISLEEYKLLRSKNCYYCSGKLPETSRALDRINNAKGYTLDNVVPCCYGCNNLRSNVLSQIETVEIIKLLKVLRNTNNIWKS